MKWKKDLERSGTSRIKILFRHVHVRTEEIKKTSVSINGDSAEIRTTSLRYKFGKLPLHQPVRLKSITFIIIVISGFSCSVSTSEVGNRTDIIECLSFPVEENETRRWRSRKWTCNWRFSFYIWSLCGMKYKRRDTELYNEQNLCHKLYLWRYSIHRTTFRGISFNFYY
jgi:hypothetical protein